MQVVSPTLTGFSPEDKLLSLAVLSAFASPQSSKDLKGALAAFGSALQRLLRRGLHGCFELHLLQQRLSEKGADFSEAVREVLLKGPSEQDVLDLASAAASAPLAGAAASGEVLPPLAAMVRNFAKLVSYALVQLQRLVLSATSQDGALQQKQNAASAPAACGVFEESLFLLLLQTERLLQPLLTLHLHTRFFDTVNRALELWTAQPASASGSAAPSSSSSSDSRLSSAASGDSARGLPPSLFQRHLQAEPEAARCLLEAASLLVSESRAATNGRCRLLKDGASEKPAVSADLTQSPSAPRWRGVRRLWLRSAPS